MAETASLAIERLRALSHRSPLLRCVTEVSRRGKAFWAYGTDVQLRRLTRAEVRQLQRQGNVAENWDAVWVHPDFTPDRVHQCQFLGSVVLGPLRGTVLVDGVPMPSGLYRATLRHCVIGPDVLIHDSGLVDRCVLGPQTVVFRTGSVLGGSGSFGNGQRIRVGLTVGGRELPLVAEVPYEDLAAVATSATPAEIEAYWRLAAAYADGLRCDCSILMPRSAILRSDRVEHVLLGPGAVIDGARVVACATLLADDHGAARIGAGAIVRSSVLQWAATVQDGAIVERSLVGEASTVGQQARVSHCIIGPNSTVRQGEATSALLGPFTAMNHEALVIATIWPGGRGNISAGARIGSNHTGKAPDQEAFLGEGLFVGLAGTVKFPVDFCRAAYSLIAAGASLLSQRVGYPFSLIMPPRSRPDTIAEGLNEILPAWVLYASPYTVLRNERKYAERNRAVHQSVRRELFTPELLHDMDEAIDRLSRLSPSGKDHYTEQDDPLLGKNFLLEANRTRAIIAYRTWIRRVCFRRLWHALHQGGEEQLESLLEQASVDPVIQWGLQRGYLEQATLSRSGLVQAMQEWLRLEHEIAVAVEQSKSREYRRGCRIMPTIYEQVHPLPSDDTVVRQCWEEVHALNDAVTSFLRTHGLADLPLEGRR